jgi:glycosyltransferase involved in cell wall biosynthesis
MFIYYSIIIPAHNEETNLKQLLGEIATVMNPLEKAWEVIVVDDGSTDGTWKSLEAMQFDLPQLKAIQLAEQSGQTAALDTGVRAAQGQIIITLDGDGQNDPKDIPAMVQALDGTDCVCGWRYDRHDTWSRRWISTIANGCRRWVLGDTIHDAGCALKVCRASCFSQVTLFKGMHRFLASLFLIEGLRVTEIPVSHRPRSAGTSNYSIFNRGFSTLVDLAAVRWMQRRRVRCHITKRLPTNDTVSL